MLPAKLSGATRLVPVLAHPVDHVQAPRVYNPAFASAGLDWCMVALGVHPDDFAATVAQLGRIDNLQGLNLTIPHKAAGHALCARLGEQARRTGVVNTMRREPDGSWSGESFDGIGFVAAARAYGVLNGVLASALDGAQDRMSDRVPDGVRSAARPVLLFGAGGAGSAIAFALAAAGVRELHVLDVDAARADRLLSALAAQYPGLEIGSDAARIGRAGLAINATPLGLHAGDPLPFDPAQLAADAALFDITAARDTELMAACSARGLAVVGGRPMIEYQAAAQIAFWRGPDSH